MPRYLNLLKRKLIVLNGQWMRDFLDACQEAEVVIGGFGGLTAEKLAQAITSLVCDSAMRQRADELGAKILSEDGVAQAVTLLSSGW